MNEENLKELIKENGYLTFEISNLRVLNDELRKQVNMLQEIIKNILNKKDDINE